MTHSETILALQDDFWGTVLPAATDINNIATWPWIWEKGESAPLGEVLVVLTRSHTAVVAMRCSDGWLWADGCMDALEWAVFGDPTAWLRPVIDIPFAFE